MAIASSSSLFSFGTPPSIFLGGPVAGLRNLSESPLMGPSELGRLPSPQMMDSPRPNGASQSYGGSLQQGDDLNPTRFQSFKDDYWLTFERSGWVEVDLTSQVLDSYLQVIDPITGEILISDDDSGDGFNANLRFQGEKGDRIILRASSYDVAETGDYRLTTQWSFQVETNLAAPTAGINAPMLLPPISDTTAADPREGFTPSSPVESTPADTESVEPASTEPASTEPAPAPVEPDLPASSGPNPNDPNAPGSESNSPDSSNVPEPNIAEPESSPSAEALPVESDNPESDNPESDNPESDNPESNGPATPPRDLPPLPNNFNILRGYGLVNAAAAIARIQGEPVLAAPPAGSSPLDAIGASMAWDKGATGAGVVVAVIDSGLDLDHPELQGSIWRNPGEIEGDGIDNDRNGYVDDIHGWNLGLGQNNGDVRPGTEASYQGHGTHVAGIIAAAKDGVGNTGVAYDAKIMTLRLGDATTRGTFRNAGNLVEAIYYAVNNGANVINLSLGWSDSPELQTALAYAADNNVITVSAAGNSGNQVSPVAPARYADRWGISVGAVNRNGDLALFSNQAGDNPSLRHVLAPGKRISSSHPGNSYRRRSGTSMAAPFVSGVVALMLSADPSLSAAQIRDILTATANNPS